MQQVKDTIHAIGIVPVISIENAEDAVPLAKALAAGGLPAAEITFRTAAAEAAIRHIAEQCPTVLVGAGTVLNIQQCDKALDAGAKFIVSPGYSPELVAHCQSKGVLILPGCTHASDFMRAVNAGLDTVKFFPAEQCGGLPFLQSVSAVFPTLRFMPTGGIHTDNVRTYLAFEKVVACGGTWMVKKELIAQKRWWDITNLCRSAVETMLNLKLKSVCLFSRCADAQTTASHLLAHLSANTLLKGSVQMIAENERTSAQQGQLLYETDSLHRCLYHLKVQGIPSTLWNLQRDADGVITAATLKELLFGWEAVLVQRNL